MSTLDVKSRKVPATPDDAYTYARPRELNDALKSRDWGKVNGALAGIDQALKADEPNITPDEMAELLTEMDQVLRAAKKADKRSVLEIIGSILALGIPFAVDALTKAQHERALDLAKTLDGRLEDAQRKVDAFVPCGPTDVVSAPNNAGLGLPPPWVKLNRASCVARGNVSEGGATPILVTVDRKERVVGEGDALMASAFPKVLAGGRYAAWSKHEGGGYENEGQALKLYDVAKGTTASFPQYFVLENADALRLKDGREVLLVSMRDGGAGFPHLAFVDPSRGQIGVAQLTPPLDTRPQLNRVALARDAQGRIDFDGESVAVNVYDHESVDAQGNFVPSFSTRIKVADLMNGAPMPVELLRE